jgi:transposase InsO family protein
MVRTANTLPRNWPRSVKSAMMHVISLAQYATMYTRSWAANSVNPRLRQKADLDERDQEIARLREHIRILLARIGRIPAHQRPQYPPTDRLAILELKAACAWSLKQTAKNFLLTPATIASWMKRVDEYGPEALVQVPVPVNKFPEFTRYIVQRLKTLCPILGKVKIAQILARASLHLGATTVGRILKEKPHHEPSTSDDETSSNDRIVTAKYPNHVMHVDLTIVPTSLGYWSSWSPFALPQRWPFAYWVVLAVDHFSRRVMGATAFTEQPDCRAVCSFLGRTISKAKKTPRYIVCDRGSQFDCGAFRKWCSKKGIRRPRYGAVGRSGSIAVFERSILTIKCLLMMMPFISFRREECVRQLLDTVQWYNEQRPHTWLGGKTPNEVYFGTFPANRRPRFEPRARWPRGSPCARPWALVRGSPGAKLTLDVSFYRGHKHLPIVTLRRTG